MSRFAALFLTCAACAEPLPVMCGPGTLLQGTQCVIANPDSDAGIASDGGSDAGPASDGGSDAGVAVELPSAAIITPSPVRVMQGFAACPSITVAWADGRSALLILDPEYQVPLANAVHLASTGLTLRWVSSTGLVSTAKLPHCDAAIVGELPGSGSISLEASAPDGSSRVIGTVAVEVLALPSSGLTLTSVGLETPAPVVFPTHEPPTYFPGGSAVPVGETKTLHVALEVTGPNLNGVGFLFVPDHLVFTSSDPGVVELLPLGRVKGLREGITTLGVSYSVGGQTLGSVQSPLWVSASQQTLALGFGLPVDDRGFVLPEGSRAAETVVVGQCFSFKGVAGTVGTRPGATMPAAFARDITATATWSAQGQGLTQTPGAPPRFCATNEGEAAVRLCEGSKCANLGIVVVAPPLAFPTLQVTIPAEIRVPHMSGLQTACVDFQVTAQFAAGPRDITHSVALSFRKSFFGGRSPIYVDYSADGTPRFEQGKLCLVLEPDAAGSSLRVFWGSGQVEVNTLVKDQ